MTWPTTSTRGTRGSCTEVLKANVGRQVQAPRPHALGKLAAGAERPAAGRPHRLQPEHPGEDEVDVFTREAAVEPLQNKNAETVGRATKRAAQELTGDDKNFVVTTDLGNKFATLDRELPKEAVRRTKRPEDRNATAVVAGASRG